MRRTALCVALALMLGAGAAFASSITTDWAGVYKRRFENGMTSGERYESENVLEVVQIDAHSAYIRTRLNFSNGHQCSFYGVAQVEGESLVYREPNPPAYRGQCVLTLSRVDGQMVFSEADDSRCYIGRCGARGAFNRQTLPVSSQRRIRYMDRLLASRQYAEAMQEAGRAP